MLAASQVVVHSDGWQHWAAIIGIIAGIVVIGAAAGRWLDKRLSERLDDHLNSRFEPNGGSSFADKLDRVEATTKETNVNVSQLTGRVDQFVDEVRTDQARQWDAIGGLQHERRSR